MKSLLHVSPKLSAPVQRRLSRVLASAAFAVLHLMAAACGLLASDAPAEAAVAPPPTAIAPLFAEAAGKISTLEVITRTDLRQMMGLETEKQLMGCETDSCLAEISDALGADLVLFLTVDQLGESIVVSTTLHTAKAELVGRRVIRAISIDALADQIPAVVDALVGGHLKASPKKSGTEKLKLLINYKDAPKAKPAATPSTAAPTVDYQASIAAAKKAAEEAQRKAMAQVEEAQRKAMEASRFPPLGFVGDITDLSYCIETGVPRLLQSEVRYRSWRPPNGDAVPTCKERYISYGLYQGYDHAVAACTKAIKTAPWNLKEDAKTLTAAIQAALPVVAEAEAYYDDEDYLEDNCVTAKRLHPLLLEKFKVVRRSAINITSKLDDIAIKRTAERKGSAHFQALGEVVHEAMVLSALAPIVGKGPLTAQQLKAMESATKTLRAAISKTLQMAPPPGAELKAAWATVVSRLKEEDRWFKVTVRALNKKAGQTKVARRENMFDPTELRMHVLELSRALAMALPYSSRQ